MISKSEEFFHLLCSLPLLAPRSRPAPAFSLADDVGRAEDGISSGGNVEENGVDGSSVGDEIPHRSSGDEEGDDSSIVAVSVVNEE